MITYDKYDNEIREAYQQIGALKAKLELAHELAERRLATIEALTTQLTQADDILAESMGLDWCDGCEGYHETEYVITHKQTYYQPEEGVNVCTNCGQER